MAYQILDTINSPQDIKQMSVKQLENLAEEIRHFLMNTVAVKGGHLAPNLGVVELTLAIHNVFCSPKDKIIWDVGHQCYVHKILTGRREDFHTLREFGGLSGFPNREESPHDVFETGHSSTSVSAALGMAIARDIRGEKYKVVAVIGDGALTGGMAQEALNHAGDLNSDLLVILNDNEMSINENVGGWAHYLSKIRVDPKYNKLKDDVEFLLKRIPAIGGKVVKSVERIKDSLKYLFVPGIVFEELGFTYFGPVDGHDIGKLKDVLSRVKSMKGPVLVHVLTKKGKGYFFAEEKPNKFHGIGPFNLKTSRAIKKIEQRAKHTYTEVFGSALKEIAARREDVVAITAAMAEGTGLIEFAAAYPERFFDVGIAEQHAVTFAAGLAAQGLRPVVAVYSTFLQRAYDQILHDVAKQKLPVIFAVDRAGFVGEDGPTHHGLFDISYLRTIPGLVIMAPKDTSELREMLFEAFERQEPCAIRYPRGAGEVLNLAPDKGGRPIKGSEVLIEGKDLAVFALGSMVHPALKAVRKLSYYGIQAALINARFAAPLDVKTVVDWARKCGKIITVEENVLSGGFGSGILEVLEKENIKNVQVVRLGAPDAFVEHGPREKLLQLSGLDSDTIIATARKLCLAKVKGA